MAAENQKPSIHGFLFTMAITILAELIIQWVPYQSIVRAHASSTACAEKKKNGERAMIFSRVDGTCHRLGR